MNGRNRWRLPVLLAVSHEARIGCAVGAVDERHRKKSGKTLWVVVDGGYAKRPFLKPVLAVGVVIVGRLRKDAGLRHLPTIEQDFHDVKEVWGAGQQQVRHIWANVGVYHLNLWMNTMVELWAWRKSHEEICDRSDSPWDDAERRPSHANRREALQRNIMQNQLSLITRAWCLPRKILRLTERLMDLAI